MSLSRHFRETILERAKHDAKFRVTLLVDAINELLTGEIEIGKLLLRDYIHATISFEPLATKLHKNSKSLQRMLGPKGNPTTQSLFAIIKVLQHREGIRLKVITSRNSVVK